MNVLQSCHGAVVRCALRCCAIVWLYTCIYCRHSCSLHNIHTFCIIILRTRCSVYLALFFLCFIFVSILFIIINKYTGQPPKTKVLDCPETNAHKAMEVQRNVPMCRTRQQQFRMRIHCMYLVENWLNLMLFYSLRPKYQKKSNVPKWEKHHDKSWALQQICIAFNLLEHKI